MSPLELTLITGLAVGLLLFGALYARDRRRRARTLRTSPKRILFPFVGGAISRRALDAALRLALADGATLVPVFLARVPMHVPLDSPLPRQCTEGMPLLETIEQRAFGLGVPVDARIERGRRSATPCGRRCRRHPPRRRRPPVATPSRDPPPPARAVDVRQRGGSWLNGAWPADLRPELGPGL